MNEEEKYNVAEDISISKETVYLENKSIKNIHGLYWSYVKIQYKLK